MRNLFKIFVLGMFMLTLANTSSAQFFFMENPLEGKPAADFTLDTTKTKSVNFTKYRDGQKAIIFFWATWCPHCREQLKELNKRKQEIADKKIKLVVIDSGESEKPVMKHLQKHKIEIEVFFDKDTVVSEKYNLVGVPTFVFINEEGIIKSIDHSLPKNYEEILLKQ